MLSVLTEPSRLAALPSSVVQCDATAIPVGGQLLNDDENGVPCFLNAFVFWERGATLDLN